MVYNGKGELPKCLLPEGRKKVYIGSDWKTVSRKAGDGTAQSTTIRTGYEVIDHYHAHGECEQFHSEIKTDMDVERLPSGKFASNELVLELTILAYNILRMIGQETIGRRTPRSKRKVRRRRLRTVIGNLIMLACHVTQPLCGQQHLTVNFTDSGKLFMPAP